MQKRAIHKAIGQMVRVTAVGFAYDPPKGYGVQIQTGRSDIRMCYYEVLDWPLRENAKRAKECAAWWRKLFLMQFTDQFAALDRDSESHRAPSCPKSIKRPVFK